MSASSANSPLGTYRYTVTTLQVFQLQVKPVVSLQVQTDQGSIHMRALDCELEGLGIVEDFSLTLDATLICDEHGLSGDARLDARQSAALAQVDPPPGLGKNGRITPEWNSPRNQNTGRTATADGLSAWVEAAAYPNRRLRKVRRCSRVGPDANKA